GFASPPGTAVPAQSDGVVIGSQFFGTVGTAAGSAPYNLGRTATHEIGHYFNLEHVWGPTNGGCGEDDFVADTPNQFTESGGCPTFPLTDNCTASGNGINYNNYLDYSDDVCLAMFTQGQKTRMLAALNGPRAGLLTSAACSGSVAVTPGKDWGEFMQVYPNPSQNVINITLVQGQIEQKLNFVLTDMLGKTHMTFGLSQAKTIDVSQLPQGIYFLTCIEFPKATQKLLITK
ncbi:MAG TPA: T9SS type A sorting domain-containing protein, partial [Bacteroidetes bacterium]|nr:T9SS type A sorting domain-containing protein [Bacteroidota bacterium]